MIKYRLNCDRAHTFDAWFPSSASFDEQARRNLVACPECGSTVVEKALMAPALARRGSDRRSGDPEPTPPDREPRQVATLPQPETEAQRQLVALMRKVRDEVRRTADYVGPKFAEEARRIHLDEAPPRGIYGEATLEDARKLEEDGIAVYPLPILPDDHH